jgi:hypothetical protein
MSRISVQPWMLKIAVSLSVLLLICASRPAHAQIGAGSLQLSIDNYTVMNGYNDGGTAQSITLGTQLTGAVSVNGVTGNHGTTTVTCYANGSELFSWSTSSNGMHTFPWKPTATGTYALYCSGTWEGTYANGTVSTPTIYIPVT